MPREADMNHDHQTATEVIDPVCGMSIAPEDATGTPICEFVPADHAVPLGPRLVLAVAVLLPTDAGRE
jgi:hypothetical protein